MVTEERRSGPGKRVCKSDERNHKVVFIDCSAIVNDRLSALEQSINPDMGHERSLFTSHFHLYNNTKVSMETP